jgi:predicted nucleic acid-binding protein
MAGSTLDDIPAGQRVFLDATIFIYHFARASMQCRRLLERCERADLAGVTSAIVLAETTHRLMMIEAVVDGHVAASGVARKLRERPDLVRKLGRYQRQVESIAGWGIEVRPLDLGRWLRSADARSGHGLLTNDSLIVATMSDEGIDVLATADRDFERVEGVRVFRPTDVGSGAPALA